MRLDIFAFALKAAVTYGYVLQGGIHEVVYAIFHSPVARSHGYKARSGASAAPAKLTVNGSNSIKMGCGMFGRFSSSLAVCVPCCVVHQV